MITPLFARRSRFACVAGCSYMFTFIAGPTTIFARVARQTVATRSSANP
jgi:hypothetical protein